MMLTESINAVPVEAHHQVGNGIPTLSARLPGSILKAHAVSDGEQFFGACHLGCSGWASMNERCGA